MNKLKSHENIFIEIENGNPLHLLCKWVACRVTDGCPCLPPCLHIIMMLQSFLLVIFNTLITKVDRNVVLGLTLTIALQRKRQEKRKKK